MSDFIDTSLNLPKIIKGVGKNTCGYASLGNFLPIGETKIHEIMGNEPLPKGLDIFELKVIMDTKLGHFVKNVEIFQPEDSHEMKQRILHKTKQDSKIIANFQVRKIYSDPKYSDFPEVIANCGHFSPIVHADQTRVCIGDVWRKVPDYCWKNYDIIFEAINTIDNDSGRKRGLLIFDLIE